MNRCMTICATLVLSTLLVSVASAQQQGISVFIDGSPMVFSDQAPVNQGGRVFVPMRAIFERLGATVVYSNGTINATRGSRTISLQIGSPNATVDGQPLQLDSPPFEIGARTMVPLRFIAQALGANVAWSEANSAVYVHTMNDTSGGAPPPPPYQPGSSVQQPGPAWADASHVLLHRPYPWGQVARPYPLINASFRRAMQPDTLRITIDGRDVTALAKLTPMGFEVTPPRQLRIGQHFVRVSGMTQSGRPISDGWSFNVVGG